MLKLKSHPELILTFILFLLLVGIGFSSDAIGDTGDSVAHYLYSRYSFAHPNFFLHHWAKPVFVLLTSPFSQFGFMGIVFFNCICAALIALFSFYTARNLKIKYPYLVFVFLFFAPLYFNLIFSGLTEYLFALFLIIGIHLCTKERLILALIVISFLPLVRSEGLIIMGVFGLFLLFNRKLKLLPFLIVGQLVYTIIGAFYYHDLLWVINKIPYANIGSPYGIGGPFDFFHRLNYVIEKPIYILLSIGIISVIFALFKSRFRTTADEKTLLVMGSFVFVFVAHSIFWWQGIFNSMGLPRVLIAVMPSIALLALIGTETITSFFAKPSLKNSVLGLLLVVVCSFPFYNRPEGVVFNKELFTIPEKTLIDEEVIPFITKERTSNNVFPIYYSNPYLSSALDIDHFNQKIHRNTRQILADDASKEALIIWDDWFSVNEHGISLAELKEDKRLTLVKTFKKQDQDRTITFAVFKRTD